MPALFASSGSRRGADLFASAASWLQDHGIRLAESGVFDSVHELKAKVKASNETLIIVGGGDGTLSSVVELFENSDRVLGVLPFGTGNAFARDLGVAENWQTACQAIADGAIATVDVGVCNGKRFLNVATLGLSTLIARDLNKGIKKYAAGAAYLFALTRALARVKPFEVTLSSPQAEEQQFPTLQVVIGNGRFHAGSLLVSENAGLDTGKLQMYALASTNKWDLLRLAIRLRSGRQGELPEVKTFAFSSAHLETRPGKSVTLDGEVLGRTPLQLSVLPKAIQVAVPKDWDSHSKAPP
jgi:YegS/Rv2252/BmrU family lipid kinase